MTEQVYVTALIVGGVVFVALLITATIALCLGRGLRARGVARLGADNELSMHVEVPAARPSSALLGVPPPDILRQSVPRGDGQ